MSSIPKLKHGWLARAALSSLIGGLCAIGQAQAQGLIIGRVTRVHDGESVTVRQGNQEVVVHLVGLEAPADKDEVARGSRDALHACAFGRGVIVAVHGTDRSGRTVGRLESMGRDCSLVQLRAGWARYQAADAASQPPGDRNAYAAAERAARQRHLGLWAQPDTAINSAGGPAATASAAN